MPKLGEGGRTFEDNGASSPVDLKDVYQAAILSCLSPIMYLTGFIFVSSASVQNTSEQAPGSREGWLALSIGTRLTGGRSVIPRDCETVLPSHLREFRVRLQG